MNTQLKKRSTFRRDLYQRAILDSFVKLDPRRMLRNPVMFVVEVGSLLTTVLWIQALFGWGEAPAGFIGGVALWLWFTVLFANFSEAVAEGRGKAQAEALRKTRQTTQAKKLPRQAISSWWKRTTSCPWMARSSKALRRWMRAPSPARAPR
jgi:K+-transporting ATPase ATPase B chain